MVSSQLSRWGSNEPIIEQQMKVNKNIFLKFRNKKGGKNPQNKPPIKKETKVKTLPEKLHFNKLDIKWANKRP